MPGIIQRLIFDGPNNDQKAEGRVKSQETAFLELQSRAPLFSGTVIRKCRHIVYPQRTEGDGLVMIYSSP